ncbi:MAG: glycosyltransferase [Gemmatimonadetes bacterium]|nr:glycosyltransferase [Gemmatimonadota bacterium]
MTSPRLPVVSVVMPCRDAAHHLPECIASLEAQTEARYEVVVLDDHSTDRTGDVLAAWSERDPRVRLFRPHGVGIVPALQRLCREARAPLLARMDADDRAAPDRLRAQVEFLRSRADVSACGTGVSYVPRPEAGSGYHRYERWLNALHEPGALLRDLFVECPIAHPTLMIRRRVLEDVGGYRSVDGPEDYDLMLRLAEAGHALANIPKVLLEWRRGPDRLSERSDRYSADAFRKLKVAFLRRGFVPMERPLVVWGAGRVGKAFVRAWYEGGGRPIDAFVDLDPRKIGQVVHGAPVIPPTDERLRSTAPSASPRRPYVLAAVGSPGARSQIRDALAQLGLVELEDYRAVA